MQSHHQAGMASYVLPFIIIIIITSIIPNCWSLKLVKIEVPRYKVRGDLAILECQYELEGDTLYAVKWYKENEEFYRYVPRSQPPKASYPVLGVRVDIRLSDSRQVYLREVNLKSSGMYRCEVSAEAPSFASAAAEAPMTVLFIPAKGPHISGEQKQYLIGDEVNLNCTSGKSFPASVLRWYVNDQEVTDENGLIRYEHQIHPHGLYTTTLGLRLRMEARHYDGDAVRLRCVASLSPVIWTGDQESVVGPIHSEKNREALLLVKGGSRRNMISVLMLLICACVAMT